MPEASLPEASLRQPCARIGCVFPATLLDSGRAPPIKLLPGDAFPPKSRMMRNEACPARVLMPPRPQPIPGKEQSYAIHR